MNLKSTIGLTALLVGCPKTQNAVEAVPEAAPAVEPEYTVVKKVPAANQVLIAQYLFQTGEQHINGFYGRAYDLPVGDVTLCYKEQGVPDNYADDVLVLGVGTHATYIDEGLDGVVDYIKDPHTTDRILFSSLSEQEQLTRRAEYDIFISDYVYHIQSEGF